MFCDKRAWKNKVNTDHAEHGIWSLSPLFAIHSAILDTDSKMDKFQFLDIYGKESVCSNI